MRPIKENALASRSCGAGGLTLAEVVACVAVGAILVGVTVAALARAGGASRRQVCLNNLRIISAASADYAEQDPAHNAIPLHRGVNFSARIGDYQYGGKSGDVEHLEDHRYTIEGGYGFYTRPLNRLLYDVNDMVPPECRRYRVPPECIEPDKNRDVPIYRCPSDTGYTGLHFVFYKHSGRSSYDYFGTSYVANTLMVCMGSREPISSNSPFLRSLERIPNPGRTIQYMENCGRFAWAWGYGPWPFGTDFTVGGWHGRDWWFNAVFADGHADYLRMKGQGETGLSESVHDVEYVPGLPGGMQDWWQVIMRGPGWQRDCLPSPPVPTRDNCGSLLSGAAEQQAVRLAAADTELTK